MKVNKNDFKKILSKIKVCIGKTPQTSLVAFQNKEGNLKITATDGSNVVIFNTTGDLSEELEFVLDYKSFTNICKLRGKELEFVKEENKLTAKDDNTEMDYAVNDISVFNFSKYELTDQYMELNTKDFQKIINHGSFVRQEKNVRPFMTGVEVKLKEKNLIVLSTDGKRIAKCISPVQSEKDMVSVFSGKCIEAIKTFESETIKVRFNDRVVNFNVDGYDYYMNKLDCSFPDTERFFTEDTKSQYEINRISLIESLDLLQAVSDEVVNIECKENKITLMSSDVKNTIKDVIEGVKLSGDDFDFKVSRNLFSEIFKNLDSEKIIITYKDESSPIGYIDNEGSVGVIMPLKKC